MQPNSRTDNFMGLIGNDKDCQNLTPKHREEQRLADIAANIVPQVVATFETTVSPAATKCDKKYADLQAAVAAGKTIVAKIKDKAPVLYLASDGGANGPMTFQGDVWGGTFSASTGPGTHTYDLCTLTKADVATIETNEA